MHHFPLLINIAMALGVAFFGGWIARRLGLPTLVGYMLSGIIIGPFTPGFVGDPDTIRQLAELGVVFLMFGVGLHFSLSDLLKVRDIAIPGAIFQTSVITVLGFALARNWGWSTGGGLVLGLAVSVASTVVLLRNLMDNGLLNTSHGQAAVGWLIVEDLATVLILVLLPAAVPAGGGFAWGTLVFTLLKAAAFVALALFLGARLIPWLLLGIAHTRSRELFILAALLISLGTALGASELFGVSLALGAFVAGAIINESPLSHQVGADLMPFREAFTALFFVSIGMLVNPGYLLANIGPVLALTALILVGKTVLTVPLAFVLPRPIRTILVVAVGIGQIGEFSFVIGQAGMSLGLLNADQYSLIMAGALLSITVNPLAYRLIDPVERLLQRNRRLWALLDRHRNLPEPVDEDMSGHVVIVGYGRVGSLVADLLSDIGTPCLVVEADAARLEVLNRRRTPVLYGDAANSEVITHADLRQARALVVTMPDEAAARLVVTAARDIAPDLPIVARAATDAGARHLLDAGASHVVHPELEGGLEMLRHTLAQLGFPGREVYRALDAVRRDHFEGTGQSDEEHRVLRDLVHAAEEMEITWVRLPAGHEIVGRTLAEANLRARSGASVVAILRAAHLMANPKSMTVFEAEDRIGLIGEPEQIAAVERMLTPAIEDVPQDAPASV